MASTYAAQQAEAEKAYQDALAGLSRDQRRLFEDYGFQGTIDDKGVTNFTIDPVNQHGMANQMLRSHASAIQAMRDELTGRHLGRTGLASQRQRLLRFIQSGDYTQLANRFQDAANAIFRNRGQALRSRDAAMLSSQLGAGAGGGDSNTPPPNDRVTDVPQAPSDAAPVGPGPLSPFSGLNIGQQPAFNYAGQDLTAGGYGALITNPLASAGGGTNAYDPYTSALTQRGRFSRADIY